MKERGRQPIRQSLMLMLMATATLALVLATLGFAASDWYRQQQILFDRLQSQAAIIGHNTRAALSFFDEEAALRTLSSLENQDDILVAVVYGPDNLPFAVYRNGEVTVPEFPPDGESGLIEDRPFFLSPVMLDDERMGSVLLISDPDYWQRHQQDVFLTVVLVFIVALLASIPISHALQGRISVPLIRLAQTARSISRDRDYKLRAEKLSDDEIGDLVEDFNEMLRQIQSRDARLRESQERLEEKVDERTRELSELARQLEHQAYHDTLTGLANRITFDDHLALAINQTERTGGMAAVLFLDLDRFKVINDTLGHAVGDRLLQHVASRLASSLRSSDTLARFGGDEFAVLLPQVASDKEVTEVATKLIETINRPFEVDGYSLHITTSIGISLFPNDGDCVETIMKNADTAMYRSKDRGKNQFKFFAPEMNARAVRRLHLETRLREAILNDRFTLHYQPRWDTQTGQAVGVEALIRWNDADEGYIAPAEFIPLAEECGLTAEIDEWVLRHACKQVKSWYAQGLPGITLSVNLSATQFIREDLAAMLGEVLRDTGFPGERLELEITESAFGPEAGDVLGVMSAIREFGIEFAIDDFGKAYSSLSRLKQLPLHTLKIDGSFIRDLGLDVDDEVLVRTIIDMAHNLGLKVVAEGVESALQYDFVKQHGCDIVQGHYLSEALNEDSILEVLQQG